MSLKIIFVQQNIKKLSISQRQAIIKLIEKKDKNKTSLKKCHPISLLIIDYTFISKALAAKLKNVLLNLILLQQTVYVRNRFICESSRLIANMMEITDIFNKEGFLVTMGTKKAFDSLLYHAFLISVLKSLD